MENSKEKNIYKICEVKLFWKKWGNSNKNEKVYSCCWQKERTKTDFTLKKKNLEKGVMENYFTSKGTVIKFLYRKIDKTEKSKLKINQKWKVFQFEKGDERNEEKIKLFRKMHEIEKKINKYNRRKKNSQN